MSILDKVMGKFTTNDKITPTLSICMMGPRSVGKTTVMTSIFSEAQDHICEGCRINLRAMDDNTKKLGDYHTMLVEAVAKKDAANLPASNTESKFLFGLGLAGKQPSLKLSVQDFPGEYLTSSFQEKRDEVYQFMADATVILIAIDTPYLMETSSEYDNTKNKIDLVTHYLIENSRVLENKLVLFVPLKCERYYHDGRINEVSQKVRNAYHKLISFFEEHEIASFITPILTLGGIEFDHMKDVPSLSVDEPSKLAIYRSWEKRPKYAPMFCPQPMYYLLTYVVNYYEWQNKQAKGFFDRFIQSFNSLIKSDSTFYDEMKKLTRYVMYNKDGFTQLTTNKILKIN